MREPIPPTDRERALLRKLAGDTNPAGAIVAVGVDGARLAALAQGARQSGRYIVAMACQQVVRENGCEPQYRIVIDPDWGHGGDHRPWPEGDPISMVVLGDGQDDAGLVAENISEFMPFLSPGGVIVLPGFFAQPGVQEQARKLFPNLEREPTQGVADTLVVQPASVPAGNDSPVHLCAILAAANRDLRLPMECIRRQEVPLPVVLVDGGDNTLPADWEHEWFRIEADPGQPFHEARLKNLGLLAAVGTHALILNADICLPPGQTRWIERALKEKPHVLYTAGLVDVDEETTAAWRERNEADWNYGEGLRGGAFGDFMVADLGFLKAIGGFDEEFVSTGVLDDHLVHRWMAAGRLVLSAPPVYHLDHLRRDYQEEWNIYAEKLDPVQVVANWTLDWGQAFPRPERARQIRERLEWFEKRKQRVRLIDNLDMGMKGLVNMLSPLAEEGWKEWA